MDSHDSDDRKTPSKDPTSSDPDSGVGYRRPPEHARFQPGTSGNRRGRPPGSKNRKTVIAEIAEEMRMSMAAVYKAKSRVLRRVRQELEGLLD